MYIDSTQLDITTQTLNEIICTSDWLFQQPTINGQHAYIQVRVAPGLGSVYVALNLSSGDVLWYQEKTTGYASSTDKIYVINNIVYITQTDGIVARDAKTGEVIWQTNHNWMLNAGIPEGGLIWYPTSKKKSVWNSLFASWNNANGTLVGIDPVQGEIQKTINLLPEAKFSKLLYINNQRVIGLDKREPCKIFSVNQSSTDKMAWEYQLQRCYGYIIYPAVYGNLFIFETPEQIWALNLSTGQEAWSVSPMNIEIFQPKDTTAILPFCMTKQVPGLNPEYILYGIDVINGIPVWAYHLETCSKPTIVDGVIYTGNGKSIDALDLTTGELLWQVDVDTEFEFFSD